MKWYLKVLRQYSDFKGRARRKEYFMFGLFNALFGIIAMVIASLLINATESQVFIVIYIAYFLATLIPSVAVTVRRMHDIGKSGWMILVSCIPFIGAIWLFILLVTEGEIQQNEYGMNPKHENFLAV